MLDFIIWVSLMMSLGTGVLAVWVFGILLNSEGSIVVPVDKYTEIELIASILILCVAVIALICFTVRKLRH